MEHEEFDDLVQCPWCTNVHNIVKKRLEIHYSKLKQNNDPCVRHLRTCRYNSHHKFHKKEADKHYAECQDAKNFIIREALHAKEAAQNEAVQQNYFSGDIGTENGSKFEEDWDDEYSTTEKFVPDSFRVPDDYRYFYDDAPSAEIEVAPNPVPKVKVDVKNLKPENQKKNSKPENHVACHPEKDKNTSSQSSKVKTMRDTTGIGDIRSTAEDTDPLEDKKMIRKLEKKLKEIKKLEEKSASSEKPNLTKEELEKMSKRDDIEKLLADLKLKP